MSSPWGEVEGGLEAILASAVQTQAQQTNGGKATGSVLLSPSLAHQSSTLASSSTTVGLSHRPTRSSIIHTEELVSLSSSFGKLGAMLATVCDIATNLSVNVDAFLVSEACCARTIVCGADGVCSSLCDR